MHISVHLENPSTGMEKGSVVVGWLLSKTTASIIYDPPVRVRSPEPNRTHAKSASRCPAVINLESRYFEIKCPFDLNIGLIRDDKGKPALRNLAGEASPVRGSKLREVLHLVPEHEWRYKDRPTVQIMLPYIFMSDEPVYLTQLAPFMHYRQEQWPGTLFGGRFPINVWPRVIQWAFEWWDVSKPLVLKRGEPLCYLNFETMPQDRPVQVVEAQHTPEVDEYIEAISGAVNYVNQTFSLFKAAEERRPTKLVFPRERK